MPAGVFTRQLTRNVRFHERLMNMATDNKMIATAKTILGGSLLLIGAVWFWYHAVGNPINEFALIRRAQIATGTLIDTYEDEQEDYRGHVYFSDVGVYTFNVPGGREFKTLTRVPTGQLKERQEIEYLSDAPSVNRVKGDGCRTVFELLWRKIGLGGLLLVLFAGSGIALLQNGIREIQKTRTTATHNPRPPRHRDSP